MRIEFCDQVSQRFRELAEFMNFSNDDFIRTTEERHKIACQDLWVKLEENGHIYLDKYSGWYSVRDEAYYAESETEKRDDGTRVGPQGTEVEFMHVTTGDLVEHDSGG